MLATIDSGGRIVVPKALRERLGLKQGTRIEMVEHDGWLEVAPAPTPMALTERDGAIHAVTDQEMLPLSQETVRQTLEKGRP